MSRGGIIIQNRTDGRGMMLPEREGKGTFNKLPFVSMTHAKQEIGINPCSNKIIVKTKKFNQKIKKDKKRELEDKLYPLENYRKLKTSEQFWKKNENPIYKDYNKKDESQTINNKDNQNKTIFKEKSSNQLNNITLSNTKVPKKLNPIVNKTNLKNKLIDEKKNDDINNEIKPKLEEVKITKQIKDNNNNKKILSELLKDKNQNNNNIEKNNINKEIEEEKKEVKKEEKEEVKEEIKEEKDTKEEEKELKDPLLESLDGNENIEDVLQYLNGLDYDKYCKDMEIREALTLLKNKIDKEQEEKDKEEEKNKNKVIIEGVEQNDSQNEEEDEKEEKEGEENKESNKLILPEINSKIPGQNTVEIVNEEELKKKEEIKKYKIAEQIAKTDQMKAVHSANSIRKLLQREGLEKIEPQPLKIAVIKENPIAEDDGYESKKLPFLHSLPLV